MLPGLLPRLLRRRVFPIGDLYEDEEYEVDPPDDWDGRELCRECGDWTEHGIFSELDDSFVCDDCAIRYTHD